MALGSAEEKQFSTGTIKRGYIWDKISSRKACKRIILSWLIMNALHVQNDIMISLRWNNMSTESFQWFNILLRVSGGLSRSCYGQALMEPDFFCGKEMTNVIIKERLALVKWTLVRFDTRLSACKARFHASVTQKTPTTSWKRIRLNGAPYHPLHAITNFILLQEKFLQFDWLRAVVFQRNLKYLHVKITNLLRVVI